jgi:hypothetical protein
MGIRMTYDALEVIKQVLEGDENELGFEMSVLGKMSALSAISPVRRG